METNQSLRLLTNSKRGLNQFYNELQARVSRGNRSNATRRRAAAFSFLKRQHKNLFGSNYSRHRNITMSNVRNATRYKYSPNGLVKSRQALARGNTETNINRAIEEELASGRNLFANFDPRAQFAAMRASISPEEIAELSAGLNNNNTASTTSTGSFESAKSQGGLRRNRRRTNKNLKRKSNTRRRK